MNLILTVSPDVTDMLRFPAVPLKPSSLTIITKLSTPFDGAIGAAGPSLAWLLPIAARGEPFTIMGDSTATRSRAKVATASVLLIASPPSNFQSP